MISNHPSDPKSQFNIWKYGDNINTDVIFPGKYVYTLQDPDKMAAHALEDLDPHFSKNVQQGDVIIAGNNFGNGSSREQAVTCLKAAGVQAVIAISFGRIWYRNAINQGLPAIILPQAVAASKHGAPITIDFNNHHVSINAQHFIFPPFSDSTKEILEAGGLLPYIQQKLANA